jgi:hypothetical protein
MFDSPHTSSPMLMRGNAMVLKNTCRKCPDNQSIEKHLSWSSDIPPAARFPPHRSRPAGYQHNRQPATVGAEERGGRGTTSRRTTTRAAPELSPPKPACAGDAVLRTSTQGTVPMGQCAGRRHRGPHLTVSIPEARPRRLEGWLVEPEGA